MKSFFDVNGFTNRFLNKIAKSRKKRNIVKSEISNVGRDYRIVNSVAFLINVKVSIDTRYNLWICGVEGQENISVIDSYTIDTRMIFEFHLIFLAYIKFITINYIYNIYKIITK